MSVKVMSYVWECEELKGSDLLVMLALADHANDDGVCWPSIPRIATRARISERQTQRVIGHLQERGYIRIVTKGDGRGHSTLYQVTLKDDRMSPLSKIKDDTPSPIKDIKGDILSQRVTFATLKGDIAMSPEPSYNHHIEPSINDDDPPTGGSEQQDAVFVRLQDEWMTVNTTQLEGHRALVDRYGFEAWLRGFDACKRSARSNLSYVEKVILTELDKSPPPPPRPPPRKGFITDPNTGKRTEVWT